MDRTQPTQICIDDTEKVFSQSAFFPPDKLAFSRTLFYELTNAKDLIPFIFPYNSIATVSQSASMCAIFTTGKHGIICKGPASPCSI